MSKAITIGALFIILCSCASSKPWTKTEKVAAGFFLLGKAADWRTTERWLDRPNSFETNPILGEHPSDIKLGIYFPITSLAVLGICHYYPRFRIPLLSLHGVINWGYARHNYRLLEEK